MNDFKQKASVDIHSLSSTELINQYLPLVRSIAYRVGGRFPSNVDTDDLINVGLIGLMDAAEKFRPDQGKSFRSYAELRIRGTILDELRHMDWVPRSVRRKMQSLDRARRKLEGESGVPASHDEVAAEMNLPMKKYFKMVQAAQQRQLVSLEDLGVKGEDHRDILQALEGDSPAPDAKVRFEDLQRTLTGAIKALPERHKTMITLYYFEDLPLKEIGKVLGVTESRVSQIHGEALRKLKKKLQRQTF